MNFPQAIIRNRFQPLRSAITFSLGFFLASASLLTIVNSEDAALPPAHETEKARNSDAIAVAPPPFSEGIFPCSQCHADLTPNSMQRTLTENHEDIVLRHDENNRWCLDCHDAKNRDKLHLASGKLLDFTESYKLCGQCHGPTLRDWKAGEHGKRTGSWSGTKHYLLCVSCHNPHSPRFKPLQPLPPPVRPAKLRETL